MISFAARFSQLLHTPSNFFLLSGSPLEHYFPCCGWKMQGLSSVPFCLSEKCFPAYLLNWEEDSCLKDDIVPWPSKESGVVIHQRAGRYLVSFYLKLQNVLPITLATSMGRRTQITGQACFLLFPQVLNICVPRQE